MAKIVIFLLPLFYLPNLGMGQKTAFGTLELADLVLVIFLPMLYFVPSSKHKLQVDSFLRPGIVYLMWCLIGVLSIFIFYDYNNPDKVVLFSLLKLAKFTVYAVTGYKLCRVIINEDLHLTFHYSILGCGVMTGLSLIGLHVVGKVTGMGEALPGFKSTNQISVGLSMILVYVLVLFMQGYGTVLWRKLAVICLGIMLVGSTYSDGRGGWVAAAAALLWSQSRVRLRPKVVLYFMGVIIAAFMVYSLNPEFKKTVDKTLFPDTRYLAQYKFGVAGVDDGGRWITWKNEFFKLPNAPIMGTGYYHRGGPSGLWATGSHNFWLQAFLETGLVGGLIIIFLFFKMFMQARKLRKYSKSISLSSQAALIVGFIGGLSGEYFYGGFGLLTLFLIYLPVGSYEVR